MKKLLLVVILITCAFKINAQIQSSCTVPTVLQNYYDADVKQLALKRIFEQQSPYKDSIIIPQNYQDTIWQGLAAIFNLTSISERDSVFDNYCIHHDASIYLFNSIYVKVDTLYSWTTQWVHMQTVTGYTELDNFIANYGFSISNYWNSLNVAILTTTQNINLLPFCDSIESYSGIVYSERIPMNGGGNEITYIKSGNIRFYYFTLGLGDCPSGCTEFHSFRFQVQNDCSVTYLGIYSTATYLPVPINCNITTEVKNEKENISFKIYPNPAVNFCNIILRGGYIQKAELLSLVGRTVLIKYETNLNNLDVSGIPAGIYFLRLYSGNGIFNQKIVIQ
ncbi:MAG: T9SS type A sorting domain-containing protein [Bacteroidia bacterium]|nr:T9SS type A sorting domain-containing protein [Bacteroidia bacterium]